MQFTRNCPSCNSTIVYKNERTFDKATHNNSKCRACVNFKKGQSAWNKGLPQWWDNASKGRPAWNKGKKGVYSEESLRKMSEVRKGKPLSEKHRQNLSKSHMGKSKGPHSEETKSKMRQSTIKRISQNKGQIAPRYNPTACKLIDEYGKLHGYNFQHAENGGEFYIDGYWLDGYDKEKNVVIEYYEKFHNKEKNKKRDAYRKQRIIDLLKCEFIILYEKP